MTAAPPPASSPEEWVQVLLPVHNEVESIERVLRELLAELSPSCVGGGTAPPRLPPPRRVKVGLLVCEDGSTDGTKELLARLAQELPIKLVTGPERKGYSRAVIDGMAALDAPWLLCIDSDGQCDPQDFWKFWERRHEGEMLLGWRVDRQDVFLRRFLSRSFKLFYRVLLGVPFRDPSCPYILVRKEVVDRLVPELGVLNQGFWWEFVARVHRRGWKIGEVVVAHRARMAGQTQVYRLKKMPGIGWSHVMGLFRIKRETATPLPPPPPAR